MPTEQVACVNLKYLKNWSHTGLELWTPKPLRASPANYQHDHEAKAAYKLWTRQYLVTQI